MPTLHALRCLVTVMDTGSVTAAAAKLHLSQPALSHQLSALEQELGTNLFERLPRGVRPTAAAREMARDAQLALDAADRAERSARAVAGGSAGHLRIGVAESMTVPVLAPVLRRWLPEHPDVRVSVHESSSADDLSACLLGEELDLIIGPRFDAGLGHQIVLGEEEILVAMPLDHPLADRTRNPTFGEVAACPFVHYAPASGLRAWLDAQAAQAGVTLTAAVEIRQATSAALLAAAGLGLALAPSTALHPPFPGRLRRLRPRLTRTVVATYLNESDELLASLRDALDAGEVASASSLLA